MHRRLCAIGSLALLLGCSPSEDRPSRAPSDAAYFDYVRQAPEFRRVRQDPALAVGRWNTWLYMPWRYRWTIGTGEEGGWFCRLHGINGGVADHGRGPLDWFARWNLRFYNDHTAGKGELFLQPDRRFDRMMRDPRAVRPWPVGDYLLGDLRDTIRRNIRSVRDSPLRVAYSLDDEISTGSLMRPIAWRINDDKAAYERWLRSYYGQGAPKPSYVTPDQIRKELRERLREIDLSPLLDRMTYNDSVWANLLGELVAICNQEDPATPCGFVGGQGPSLWGGYDWAKLAKKVQFVEAYEMGSAPEIVRSFNPDIPRVTTHFHNDGLGIGNDKWIAWHYFAHGHRGMVGWVQGWFEPDGRPRSWLTPFGHTLRELGGVQGPKLVGARWLHDGVALYYSHPSIQVSWMLDAEPHGRTWVNRNNDHTLGTSHLVRKAWEFLLNDAGLQYNFLSYDEVVLRGVPAEYKVLILPACYALSSIEARRIADFASQGGTVIADFACGLFDPHGRGRRRGALDDLFGVRHNGRETRKDFFGGGLWVETDQDAGYKYEKYRELFATTRPRLHNGFAIAERKLPVGTSRQQGKGRAVYLNLSPQRYLMHREEGTATDDTRRIFLDPVRAGGAVPWIRARPAGPTRMLPLEVTYWSKGGRTLVFVLQNVPIRVGLSGENGSVGLVKERIPVEIRLAAPVTGVIDERTGRPLPDGERFVLDMDTTESLFFSFAGAPPSAASSGRISPAKATQSSAMWEATSRSVRAPGSGR